MNNDDKLSREQRIERARITLAKVLNMIEDIDIDLSWASEEEAAWCPRVRHKMQVACTKLGFALAALTRRCENPENVTEG